MKEWTTEKLIQEIAVVSKERESQLGDLARLGARGGSIIPNTNEPVPGQVLEEKLDQLRDELVSRVPSGEQRHELLVAAGIHGRALSRFSS